MTGTFYGLEFLKIRVSAPVFTKRFPWLSEQSIWALIDQSPQCGVSTRGTLDLSFIRLTIGTHHSRCSLARRVLLTDDIFSRRRRQRNW